MMQSSAGQLHHLDDGAHAAALLADAPREGLCELDLRRRIRAVAELVLQPLEMQAVDRAVRAEARHQETGQPARRLRQHQERVAHRRRHEPFVPGDGVALRGGNRGRGIGAHVGAALLLGHAHAERDGVLLPPRDEARVIGARGDLGRQLLQDGGSTASAPTQARVMVIGHMWPFSTCATMKYRAARATSDGAPRALPVRGPGRGMQAGLHALGHERVIGRVELDRVAAEALGVEDLQLRRILVGEARRIEHRGRAPVAAEFRQRRGLAPAPFAAPRRARPGRSRTDRHPRRAAIG